MFQLKLEYFPITLKRALRIKENYIPQKWPLIL